MRNILIVLATYLPLTAHAAERGYSITDFDRVRAEGPFAITVETGKAPSARARGAAESLERLDIQTQGRMLIIRPNRSAWGGWPGKTHKPAEIRITVPNLSTISFSGSGAMTVTRMRGQRLTLWLDGSGTLAIADVQSDRLDATIQGSGGLSLAGKVGNAALSSVGSGTLDAAKLATKDLVLRAQSSGNVSAFAATTAKVTATGSGNVIVGGSPACTVNAIGSGNVDCGPNQPDR